MQTLFFLAALTLQGEWSAAPVRSTIDVGRDGLVALRELRTAGVQDLLVMSPAGVSAHIQDSSGRFAAAPEGFREWPGNHLAWDLVDLDGDGLVELVTMTGEGRVESSGFDASGAFGEPRLLLESKSYLPRGVSRMRFARDVNGDGLADLVLPAAGRYRVHLQAREGAFSEPLEIEYDAEVQYEVGDPGRLDGVFRQHLSIPFFALEDVDGDGLQDLVSRTAERVDFHLARPEIASTPTWSLDLVTLAESLPRRRGVDLDDLISNVEQGVKWSLAELDGEAPRDLVLQLGATIRVYLGGSVRGTEGDPDQVLKISGNLLHYFLRDQSSPREAGGDGLPDLQLLRGEKIGLGRVLRWLILPGSLDFEFFTYANEDGVFSRKPTRRNTVKLEIPRLLSLIERVDEFEDRIETQLEVPARRADFDGDGEVSDVVDFVGGELLIHAGSAPPEDLRFRALEEGEIGRLLEEFVLADLDRLEDGDTQVIDLGEVVHWNFAPGAALRAATGDLEPTSRLPLDLGADDPELRPLDLDGDGRDDLVAWVKSEEGGYRLQLLVQAR